MANPVQIHYVDSGAMVTWVHTGYVETFNLDDMVVINENPTYVALLCIQYQNYLGIFRRENNSFVIVSADPAVWRIGVAPGFICVDYSIYDIIVNRHSATGALRWGFIEVPGARLV